MLTIRAMHYQLIAQMKKQLRQLDTWLEAAEKNAESRKFDPNVLVHARLAPDQFAFARQVQSTCDAIKFGVARLLGKDAPSNPDTESTIAELRARVASTLSFVDGFSEKDFAGASAAVVTTPRWEGRTMTGTDYLLEHVLPNFYFHATTTYALLRQAGVPVGKRDFLGPLTQKAPAA